MSDHCLHNRRALPTAAIWPIGLVDRTWRSEGFRPLRTFVACGGASQTDLSRAFSIASRARLSIKGASTSPIFEHTYASWVVFAGAGCRGDTSSWPQLNTMIDEIRLIVSDRSILLKVKPSKRSSLQSSKSSPETLRKSVNLINLRHDGLAYFFVLVIADCFAHYPIYA